LKFLKLLIIYTLQQYHQTFLSTKQLTPEAVIINCIISRFIMIYEEFFLCMQLSCYIYSR